MNAHVYQMDSESTRRFAQKSKNADTPTFPARPLSFKRLKWFAIVWIGIGVIVGLVHLNAIGLNDTPEGPAISVTQGFAAAGANMLGPWSGHIVRVVNFPNAGLRSFSMLGALGLTVTFVILIGAGYVLRQRPARWTVFSLFLLLMPVWYGYGFYLIADGSL